MLGAFLTVDGNDDTQVNEMREIAEQWHKKERVGHLNRIDAWLVLNTTVMKSLEYPLLVTNFSQAE